MGIEAVCLASVAYWTCWMVDRNCNNCATDPCFWVIVGRTIGTDMEDNSGTFEVVVGLFGHCGWGRLWFSLVFSSSLFSGF